MCSAAALPDDCVVLHTDDFDEIVVQQHIARRCGLLAKQLDAFEEEDDRVIHVGDVSHWALYLILDYCEHDHPGLERPSCEAPPVHERLQCLGDEEDSLLQIAQAACVDPNELCELASAAYILDCKPIVELTCKAIAGTIRGRSPEQIRRLFNIVNDFTPEEELQVKRSVLEQTLMMPCPEDSSEEAFAGVGAEVSAPAPAPAPAPTPAPAPAPTAAAGGGGGRKAGSASALREKLREKLQSRSAEEAVDGSGACTEEAPDEQIQNSGEDSSLALRMSVDELVAYINESDGGCPKKAKRKKRLRRKKAAAKAAKEATVAESEAIPPPETQQDDQGTDLCRDVEPTDEASNHNVVDDAAFKLSDAEFDDSDGSANVEVDEFRRRLEQVNESQISTAKTALAPDLSEALRNLSWPSSRSPSPSRSSSSSSCNSVGSAPETPTAAAKEDACSGGATVDIAAVRASTLRQRIDEMKQLLSRELFARQLLEKRLEATERELGERVRLSEETARLLEQRLKAEQTARLQYQAKMDRRLNALEHLLVVSPSPSPRPQYRLYGGRLGG